MSTYVSTAEHAKQIRHQLKTELGLTQKDVSVRAHSYSMGASIYVTLKTTRGSLDAVSAIARQHEHVRYCEVSGDILSGGNTYVQVRYDRDVLKSEAAKYTEMVAGLDVGDFKVMSLVSVRRATAIVYLVGAPWMRGGARQAFGANEAAELLAETLLNAPDVAKPANEVAA